MHSCMKWNGNMRSPFFILLLKFRSANMFWKPTVCQILGYMFLDVSIKENTWHYISSGWPQTLFWPSLRVLLSFSERETGLTFAEAQIYWCWMLVNPINTFRKFRCWSFYSSLIWPAAGIMSTLACEVEKHMAGQSLPGWEAVCSPKRNRLKCCQ